jgi:hypothetical protein
MMKNNKYLKSLPVIAAVLCGLFCLSAAASEKSLTFLSAQLNSSGQQPSDGFGIAVAIDGDTAVVGATGAQVNGSPTGAAYVFVKPSTGWVNTTQTATLTASDNADQFGASVAISGDTIVVGAPRTTVGNFAQEGAVYVYVKPSGGWTTTTETAKLTGYHVSGIGLDWIGTTVAIDGNTIVAGAPNVFPDYHALGEGEAFVYAKPKNGWKNTTETAVLYYLIGGIGFAHSIAINGNTIAVGADGCCYQGETTTGAGFVFVEPKGGWKTTPNPNAVLTSPGAGANDAFGYAVAIAGDTVVVGSPQIWDYEVGAAYVYVEPTGGWTNMTQQTAELYPSFTVEGDFGEFLAMSGNTVLIGAPLTDVEHGQQGASYIFTEPKSGWVSTMNYAAMLSTANGFGYNFGQSVSISGSTTIVGVNGTSSTNGAAFVFWPGQ